MKKTAEYEAEMEKMEMEEHIHVFRKDLDGDPLLSAKLVKAAVEENWPEVERLLDAGADPRICRFGAIDGVESALYYALWKEQYDIAIKLYDAGDRLDDLIIDDAASCYLLMPNRVLGFLSREMRDGRNWFCDESKPLSECCRCADFGRIEQLIDTATQEELSRSVAPTVHSWIRYFKQTDRYAELLEELRRRGAKISEAEKQDLLAAISSRFGRCPKVMHPGAENVEKIVGIVNSL